MQSIGAVTVLAAVPGLAQAAEAAAAPAENTTMQEMSHAVAQYLSGLLARVLGPWGESSICGVEVWRIAVSLVLVLITLAAARLARWLLGRYVQRSAPHPGARVHPLFFEVAPRPVFLFLCAIGFNLALIPVLQPFPSWVHVSVGRTCTALAVLAVIWYVYQIIAVVDAKLRAVARRDGHDLDEAVVGVVRRTLRVLLVVISVLFVGQTVFNLNITALLASAGIAGLAVAFAAQDTIANFFGSFMLLLDRPFRVGERVLVNGTDGVVEGLGLRSTRLRTLDGHLVTIPNKAVAEAKIENIDRRPHIRRQSNLALTYDTPPAKVEQALQIVREILRRHRGYDPAFPPRVNFTEFTDWALNIQVVAWFRPANQWDYFQWCEDVNLEIMRQFAAAGIEFAFPTTTTHVAGPPPPRAPAAPPR